MRLRCPDKIQAECSWPNHHSCTYPVLETQDEYVNSQETFLMWWVFALFKFVLNKVFILITLLFIQNPLRLWCAWWKITETLDSGLWWVDEKEIRLVVELFLRSYIPWSNVCIDLVLNFLQFWCINSWKKFGASMVVWLQGVFPRQFSWLYYNGLYGNKVLQ